MPTKILNKDLKKFHIKIPREIGKVLSISELPTKKDMRNLILHRFLLLIVLCVFGYLSYEYLYITNYHSPVWITMNDGRVVNNEPNRFIIYLIVIAWSLKHIIFLKAEIKIVGAKGVVSYTFRLGRRWMGRKITLINSKEGNIK